MNRGSIVAVAALGLFNLDGFTGALAPPRAVARGSGPRVLVEDGAGTPRLAASVVAGALYPWAERRDVVQLPSLREANGEYRLRIQNDGEDTTDLVDSVALVVAEHEEAAEIVATREGTLVAVHDAAAPLRGVHETRGDRETWTFEFPRARASDTSALLVMRARSTSFAESAFFGYLATMGQGVDALMEHSVRTHCGSTCAREVMTDELERLGLPLHVTIAGARSASIEPTSPAIARTFAVPVTLPREGDPLTLRFDAPAGFWELEDVRLAAPSEAIPSRTITPRAATKVTSRGTEDIALVDGDDQRVTLRTGEHLDVRFAAEALEHRRTTFVAVRAHYRVPIGGGLLHPAAIAAHRLGLTSLPQFAARATRSERDR